MAQLDNRGQEYNIIVRQGGTWTEVHRWKNSDDSPVDLDGFVFRGQIRKTPFDRIGTGITAVCTIVDALQGLYQVTFTADDTASLRCGYGLDDDESLYYWDLEVDTGSEVVPLLFGTCKVFREVTKQ